MNRILVALSLVLSLFLVGCASGPPTAEEFAKADYGTPITQQAAQDKAQSWLKGVLKDPSSAQYDWGTVQSGWARKAPIEGGKLIWGYRLEAKINARNSFGGYNGYKPYVFMFKNGELDGVWGEQVLGSGYSATPYMGRLK